jgi:hypothetical protein
MRVHQSFQFGRIKEPYITVGLCLGATTIIFGFPICGRQSVECLLLGTPPTILIPTVLGTFVMKDWLEVSVVTPNGVACCLCIFVNDSWLWLLCEAGWDAAELHRRNFVGNFNKWSQAWNDVQKTPPVSDAARFTNIFLRAWPTISRAVSKASTSDTSLIRITSTPPFKFCPLQTNCKSISADYAMNRFLYNGKGYITYADCRFAAWAELQVWFELHLYSTPGTQKVGETHAVTTLQSLQHLDCSIKYGRTVTEKMYIMNFWFQDGSLLSQMVWVLSWKFPMTSLRKVLGGFFCLQVKGRFLTSITE